MADPPLAGSHEGVFYVRSANDDFRLHLQGRVHADFLSFFGPALRAAPTDAFVSTIVFADALRVQVGRFLLPSRSRTA